MGLLLTAIGCQNDGAGLGNDTDDLPLGPSHSTAATDPLALAGFTSSPVPPEPASVLHPTSIEQIPHAATADDGTLGLIARDPGEANAETLTLNFFDAAGTPSGSVTIATGETALGLVTATSEGWLVLYQVDGFHFLAVLDPAGERAQDDIPVDMDYPPMGGLLYDEATGRAAFAAYYDPGEMQWITVEIASGDSTVTVVANEGSPTWYSSVVGPEGPLVAWTQFVNGRRSCHTQRADFNGDLIGEPTFVSLDTEHCYDPRLAASDSGALLVWHTTRNGGREVRARLLSGEGEGLEEVINITEGEDSHANTALAVWDECRDTYQVVWHERIDGDHLDTAVLSESGSLGETARWVADRSEGRIQAQLINGDGALDLLWYDDLGDGPGIAHSRLDSGCVDECSGSTSATIVYEDGFDACVGNTNSVGPESDLPGLEGWTIEGTVDLHTNRPEMETPCLVELDGTPGPGAISREIATIPGQTYRISFDAAPHATSLGPDEKLFSVTAAGQSQTFSILREDEVARFEFEFSASQATTIVRLATEIVDPGTNWGTWVDNIQIEELACVPEACDLDPAGPVFEDGFDGCGGNVGNAPAIPNWEIEGLVDWWLDSGIDGCAVDINGSSGAGAISRSFESEAGRRYRVSFDARPNSAGAPSLKEFHAEVAGQSFPFEVSNGDDVQTLTFEFDATSELTTLTLATDIGGAFGAFIDNVRVDPLSCGECTDTSELSETTQTVFFADNATVNGLSEVVATVASPTFEVGPQDILSAHVTGMSNLDSGGGGINCIAVGDRLVVNGIWSDEGVIPCQWESEVWRGDPGQPAPDLDVQWFNNGTFSNIGDMELDVEWVLEQCVSDTCTEEGPNLIVNGDFEEDCFDLLNPAELPGWLPVSVDRHFGFAFLEELGGCGLDLNHNAPGSIEQTIATDPGASYLLEFDAGANNAGFPVQKDFRVLIGGDIHEFSSFANESPIRHSIAFNASNETTTLRFEGVSGTPYGAVIDNVEVHRQDCGTDPEPPSCEADISCLHVTGEAEWCGPIPMESRIQVYGATTAEVVLNDTCGPFSGGTACQWETYLNGELVADSGVGRAYELTGTLVPGICEPIEPLNGCGVAAIRDPWTPTYPTEPLAVPGYESCLDDGPPEPPVGPDLPPDLGAECTSPADCSPDAPYCYNIPLSAGGRCNQCQVDADCEGITEGGCTYPNPYEDSGAYCNTGTYAEGCETSDVCEADAPVCATTLQMGTLSIRNCSECETNADCPFDRPYCEPELFFEEHLQAGLRCVSAGWIGAGGACETDDACASGSCSPSTIFGIFPTGTCD